MSKLVKRFIVVWGNQQSPPVETARSPQELMEVLHQSLSQLAKQHQRPLQAVKQVFRKWAIRATPGDFMDGFAGDGVIFCIEPRYGCRMSADHLLQSIATEEDNA